MKLHAGLPSQEDLLILTLGLGGSGNNYNPIKKSIVSQGITNNLGNIQFAFDLIPDDSESKCPHLGTNGRICRNIPGELAL